MDRNLALEFVRVTESSAIAASSWIGLGDKKEADQAAVNEMRARFNQIDFCAEVVIGEGEKDEAPMLFTHELVGKNKGKPTMDLAVDPLEATDSVAYGRYNAITVIVAGPKGSLLSAPDTYMEKIAVGPLAKDVIDLDMPTKTNIKRVAKALGKDTKEITIIVLDRPRHAKLIEEIRQTGARVRLITDGDVAGAIAPSLPDSGIDMLMGIGASAEAVLASAAIKILGGEILCRFAPPNESAVKKIKAEGIKNLKKIYSTKDLTKGRDLTFTATGVIDGPLLRGVIQDGHKFITHSMVIRGVSGTVRYIEAHHHQADIH
ncbi:MAG TPA: class II fructose-bisphosphatase [Patescibacteria group bacterium]